MTIPIAGTITGILGIVITILYPYHLLKTYKNRFGFSQFLDLFVLVLIASSFFVGLWFKHFSKLMLYASIWMIFISAIVKIIQNRKGITQPGATPDAGTTGPRR